MEKLTQREKKMLYVLLYVIIISSIIFLLILPAQSNYVALKSEKNSIQTELTTAKNAMIVYDDLAGELAKAKEAFHEQKEKFYDDMTIEDVDSILTSMVESYGLHPMALTIGEVVEEDLVSYEDYLAIQKEEKSDGDVRANKVQVYNVTMSVKGSIYNVQNFVNDASNEKSLRVVGVSYVSSELDESVNISFKIYTF